MFRGDGHLINRGNTAGTSFLEAIEQVKHCDPSTSGFTALKGLHNIAECFSTRPSERVKPSDYWHALSVAAFHFIHSTRPNEASEISPLILAALEEIAKTLDGDVLDPAVACAILETYMDGSKTDRDNVLRADHSERTMVEERLFGSLYDI